MGCLLGLASCTEDQDMAEQEVDVCVKMAWSNGRGGDTRAIPGYLTSLDGADLPLPSEYYPTEITLTCHGSNYTLSRSAELVACTEHDGFYQGYTTDVPLTDNEARLGVIAAATTDMGNGGDELFAQRRDVELSGTHLLLTMHHSKALLRFAFQLSPDYDKIRSIQVTGISFNGNDCPIAEGRVLTAAGAQLVAYVYIDPKVVTTSYTNTVECTYSVYDQDGTPTRQGVVARNQFSLGSLKDNADKAVTKIEAGYYYDLIVTLNPDYLYVLSDHDNKHLTIE